MLQFFARRRENRDAAARIYAAVVARARSPELFGEGRVPDTLEGRFEMVALHLFAVTHRLMDPKDCDAELARFMSEAFITDMDAAFREMGVGDLSVPKRIKTVYRSFGGRLKAYGDALGQGGDAVAAAIARNVFADGDPAGASLSLAEYLQALLATLAATPLSKLKAGDLPFTATEMRSEDSRA